jgi:hypothetical protein
MKSPNAFRFCITAMAARGAAMSVKTIADAARGRPRRG